ncbi:MAG: hypothetical protein ABI612_21300 [Betaproteobacteria bacterium]
MVTPYECDIDATVWWGATSVDLIAGHNYRFEAEGKWNDANIECGPEGYQLSALPAWRRLLFRAAASLRPLDTGDRWFMLLGRIGAEGMVFEIGKSRRFRAGTSGTLYCSVNDVQFMYRNNRGAVNLRIVDLGPFDT